MDFEAADFRQTEFEREEGNYIHIPKVAEFLSLNKNDTTLEKLYQLYYFLAMALKEVANNNAETLAKKDIPILHAKES